jgi:hypothetical protein
MGERLLSEEIGTPFPMETLALAATAQPLVPGPLRRFDESQETPKVAPHAEGIAVTSQTSTERGVLCLNRLVPTPYPPVTLTGTCPRERDP